jgi:PAS domain S-box-containing protein
MVERATGLTGARYGALVVLDDRGRIGRFFVSGIAEATREAIGRPPETMALLGEICREGQVVRLRDLTQHPRFTGFPLHHPAMRSLVGVPVRCEGRIVGALYMAEKEPVGEFTERDEAELMAIANEAAIAVDNVRLAHLYREVEARARRLRALSELTRLVAAATEPREVCAAIARAAVTLLDAKMAWVWEDDSVNRVFRTAATFGVAPEWEDAAHEIRIIPHGQSILGAVFETRRAEYILDIQQDSRLLARRLAGEADLHACAVVPLVCGDSVPGVLVVNFGARPPFTPEEQELLERLGDHAAIALGNAHMLQRFRAHQVRLEGLVEITSQLSRLQSVESLFDRIAATCGHLLGSDSVGIRLVEGDELVRVGTWGDAEETMPVTRLRLGESLSGRIAVTGAPIVVADLEREPRIIAPHREAMQRAGYRSWLGVPIKAGERVIGVLNIRTRRPNGFSADDVAIASAFASQAAVALENSRLYAELRAAFAGNARLASVVEQAAECVMITARNGVIVYVNPAFERITGYSAAEALGQTPRLLKSGVQDQAFYEALWGTLLTGEVWRGEVVNRRKDGTVFVEAQSIAPVRDEHGEITHFVSIGQDVTTRRDLESQLRQAQKMEAVGRLAGGIAHDFNNLLTVIIGRGSSLEDRIDPGSPLARDIGLITSTAERAATLTRQLLAFSRRQVLRPKVLDLNAVAASMEAILRRMIGEHIDLVVMLDAALGRVSADQGQIEQVIVNLAINARDAMPEGGRLTIRTTNVEIDEADVRRGRGARPGPHVLLAVSDTGVGISPDLQARIFEPFFTTKEVGKGTGLGLSTVDGIVGQHGGSIEVESMPGQGTTFTILLPRQGEDPEPIERRLASDASPRGTETVLLVEDEDAVLNLVRDVLQERGYRVLPARHPDEAIQIVERHDGPIDLLLTDVVMPGMSGPAVAQRLQPLHPEMRVLYISGYPDETLGRQNVLAPGEQFLEKPFTPRVLALKVREILDS